jgi:signal transduction histidine kinase
VFREESERGLEGLAAEAAVAIDNARLFTTLKRTEERLRSLNEQLEQEVQAEVARRAEAEDALRQAQKMEAIGQLTGGIAHDFNNLLAGISGSLEVISQRLAKGRTEGIERFIVGALASTQRAAALTQRLLAFSRRQTLDPKPTDVNRLVMGMEDLIHRTVGPAIKVEVVGAAGLWPTRVDAAQLESALLNLAINARDAMPEGGRITIETANKWIDGRAGRERDLPPGQYISICVTDTGTGIPKEIAGRIFDPFFTTKPIGQGTGLGLSMIHGFVRQSGGQVRVYSEPGHGTTMCLYFPRYTGELAGDAEPMDTEIPEMGSGETVLVIDDEPTVRMLIVEVLEEAGYAALEAEDGPAGLTILQSGARVDLLVTDVGLPGGMNGRQVADAARVSRPNLKVLFVTGFAENAALANGHLDPGMAILTKPFVMAELAHKIAEMIDG